jgi:hypothetical protein
VRWATRRHCDIVRAACEWLIRRFIDAEPYSKQAILLGREPA